MTFHVILFKHPLGSPTDSAWYTACWALSSTWGRCGTLQMSSYVFAMTNLPAKLVQAACETSTPSPVILFCKVINKGLNKIDWIRHMFHWLSCSTRLWTLTGPRARGRSERSRQLPPIWMQWNYGVYTVHAVFFYGRTSWMILMFRIFWYHSWRFMKLRSVCI